MSTGTKVEQSSGLLDDLDLDVRIVESGDAADVLLANTDNGCDTVKTCDC